MLNLMLKYLKIENWTSLNAKGDQAEKFIEQRPNILLSQFCVFGILASLGHVLVDFIEHEPLNIVLADSSFIVVLVLFYVINERRYHKVARYSFLITMNIMLFSYGNMLPKESGVFLVFFPLIGGTYIFTSKDKFWLKILFTVLPIAALFALEYFDYRFFGDVNMGEIDLETSFLINLGLSTIVFSVAMNYLITLNQKAEGVLTKNNQKFKKLAGEIEVKNKSLEKTNEELDRFAYSTSHDLRAPLLSVLGLINIAKLETEEENIQQYLNMMTDRVHNLDGFIKDITDYSRNSRLAVAPELVLFDEIIDDIIESYKFNENASGIRFSKNIDIANPVKVDKKRLQVVLNNLINNAIKYHDLDKETPWINVSVKSINGHAHISVKDNGLGIRKKNQDQIFDMFYRASEKSEGSGLGLYIVKETLEKIDGNIEVTSEFGEGSNFTIKIPAMEVVLEEMA